MKKSPPEIGIIGLDLEEYLETEIANNLLISQLGLDHTTQENLKKVMDESFSVTVLCRVRKDADGKHIYGEPVGFAGIVEFEWGAWFWLHLRPDARRRPKCCINALRIELNKAIKQHQLYEMAIYAYVMKDSPNSQKEVSFLKYFGFKSVVEEWFSKCREVPGREIKADFFMYDFLKQGTPAGKRYEHTITPTGYFFKRQGPEEQYQRYYGVGVLSRRQKFTVNRRELPKSTIRRRVDTNKLESFTRTAFIFSKSSSKRFDSRECPPRIHRYAKSN